RSTTGVSRTGDREVHDVARAIVSGTAQLNAGAGSVDRGDDAADRADGLVDRRSNTLQVGARRACQSDRGSRVVRAINLHGQSDRGAGYSRAEVRAEAGGRRAVVSTSGTSGGGDRRALPSDLYRTGDAECAGVVLANVVGLGAADRGNRDGLTGIRTDLEAR